MKPVPKTHHAIVAHGLDRATRELRETAEDLADEARRWLSCAYLALFCVVFVAYFWPTMIDGRDTQERRP